MTPQEYYTKQPLDNSLGIEFVNDCTNNDIPVSVIGNGGSLELLTDGQIDKLNETRMLRCNWAFNDPSRLKKEYAIYFAQAYQGSQEEKFTQEVEHAWQTNKFKYYRLSTNVIYSFNKMCTFVDENYHPVWPTSGIQMLLTAAFILRSTEVYVTGIDLYSHKRPGTRLNKEETIEYLNKVGKTFSNSPNNSCGLEFRKENLTFITPKNFVKKVSHYKFLKHYLEVDTLVLFNIFAQFLTLNTTLHFYNSSKLEQIYNLTNNNIGLLTDYFSSENSIDKPENIHIQYNTWKLVNKTIQQLFNI